GSWLSVSFGYATGRLKRESSAGGSVYCSGIGVRRFGGRDVAQPAAPSTATVPHPRSPVHPLADTPPPPPGAPPPIPRRAGTIAARRGLSRAPPNAHPPSAGGRSGEL